MRSEDAVRRPKNSFLQFPSEHGVNVSDSPGKRPGLWRRVLYPNIYVWFVFLASLDIMMTWIVLWRGGREVNVMAHWVLNAWDLPGMVTFKFVLVVVVVLVCELVGRKRLETGRRLARWAVAANVIPVALAFVQLLRNRPL